MERVEMVVQWMTYEHRLRRVEKLSFLVAKQGMFPVI